MTGGAPEAPAAMSVPPAPPAAGEVFGERVPLAQRYCALLATEATVRGLVGPREVPRLWERHLLNCAVISDLLPEGSRIVDVGTGAGLPGLVLALRRPDVRVDLVESLQRRTDFLTEAVAALGLEDQVRVVRGRAEDAAVVDAVGGADWVTARAVAPLDRLVRWCLPLLRPGGHLLALKGSTADQEIAQHGAAASRAGADEVVVRRCGAGVLEVPTAVVDVRRGRPVAGRSAGRAGQQQRRRAARTKGLG